MSTLTLQEAATKVLEALDCMSDDQLIAALAECGDGPIAYAFREFSQFQMRQYCEEIVTHYTSNDRELLHSLQRIVSAFECKHLSRTCFAANDEHYALAA